MASTDGQLSVRSATSWSASPAVSHPLVHAYLSNSSMHHDAACDCVMHREPTARDLPFTNLAERYSIIARRAFWESHYGPPELRFITTSGDRCACHTLELEAAASAWGPCGAGVDVAFAAPCIAITPRCSLTPLCELIIDACEQGETIESPVSADSCMLSGMTQATWWSLLTARELKLATFQQFAARFTPRAVMHLIDCHGVMDCPIVDLLTPIKMMAGWVLRELGTHGTPQAALDICMILLLSRFTSVLGHAPANYWTDELPLSSCDTGRALAVVSVVPAAACTHLHPHNFAALPRELRIPDRVRVYIRRLMCTSGNTVTLHNNRASTVRDSGIIEFVPHSVSTCERVGRPAYFCSLPLHFHFKVRVEQSAEMGPCFAFVNRFGAVEVRVRTRAKSTYLLSSQPRWFSDERGFTRPWMNVTASCIVTYLLCAQNPARVNKEKAQQLQLDCLNGITLLPQFQYAERVFRLAVAASKQGRCSGIGALLAFADAVIRCCRSTTAGCAPSGMFLTVNGVLETSAASIDTAVMGMYYAQCGMRLSYDQSECVHAIRCIATDLLDWGCGSPGFTSNNEAPSSHRAFRVPAGQDCAYPAGSGIAIPDHVRERVSDILEQLKSIGTAVEPAVALLRSVWDSTTSSGKYAPENALKSASGISGHTFVAMCNTGTQEFRYLHRPSDAGSCAPWRNKGTVRVSGGARFVEQAGESAATALLAKICAATNVGGDRNEVARLATVFFLRCRACMIGALCPVAGAPADPSMSNIRPDGRVINVLRNLSATSDDLMHARFAGCSSETWHWWVAGDDLLFLSCPFGSTSLCRLYENGTDVPSDRECVSALFQLMRFGGSLASDALRCLASWDVSFHVVKQTALNAGRVLFESAPRSAVLAPVFTVGCRNRVIGVAEALSRVNAQIPRADLVAASVLEADRRSTADHVPGDAVAAPVRVLPVGKPATDWIESFMAAVLADFSTPALVMNSACPTSYGDVMRTRLLAFASHMIKTKEFVESHEVAGVIGPAVARFDTIWNKGDASAAGLLSKVRCACRLMREVPSRRVNDLVHFGFGSETECQRVASAMAAGDPAAAAAAMPNEVINYYASRCTSADMRDHFSGVVPFFTSSANLTDRDFYESDENFVVAAAASAGFTYFVSDEDAIEPPSHASAMPAAHA